MEFNPNLRNEQMELLSTGHVTDTLLEEIVNEWAWDKLHMSANRKERRLLKKQISGKEKINVTVDWSKVVIKNNQLSNLRENSEESYQANVRYQILSESIFTNLTEFPQEFTLKRDEKTKSSATRSTADQVSIGGKLALQLKSPGGFASASGELSKNFMLKKNRGETVEEENTWVVEGKIQVKEKHRVRVIFGLREVKKTYSFNIGSEVSGKVKVMFTKKKDESIIRVMQGDIVYILRRYVRDARMRGQQNPKGAEVNINESSAQINADGRYEMNRISKEVSTIQESLDESAQWQRQESESNTRNPEQDQ